MDNNNQIDGKGKSLREVFGQHYVLDYFQRDYKWERGHMAQLIDDLEYCFMESYRPGHDQDDVADYKPYFLGPYIVYKKKNLFSLIDGQQRLTSLMLLMIYIIKNYPYVKDELKQLIEYKIYKNESYVIQDDDRIKVIDYLYKDTELGDEEITSSNLNLLERYNDIDSLFPESLKSNTILPLFVCWMKEKLMFVEILSYTDESAYTIFETMNDRGLNLTPTEMLKSFLLARINDENIKISCTDSWRKNIVALVQEDKESEIEFFRAWLRGKYLENVKDRNEFEEIGTGFHRWVRKQIKLFNLKDDQAYLNLISSEMPFYIEVFNLIKKAENGLVKGLEVIKDQSTYAIASSLVYPLYLSAINQSDTHEIIIAKMSLIGRCLDSFVVKRILNGQPIAQASIKTIIYPLIHSVRGREIEDLQEILTTFLNNYTKNSPVYPVISQLPYKFLRYFQFRVNQYLLREQDDNVNYNDFRNSKLVYCTEKPELGTVVKKENYREKNDVPLYSISFYDDSDPLLIPYYELINNSDSLFSTSVIRTEMSSIMDIKERAKYLCSYVCDKLWDSTLVCSLF